MRILPFLLLYSFCTAFSQVSSGWLPKINISKKLSEKTKWVNSVESREFIYQQDEFKITHSLIDVSTILSFKTDVNQSFNAGYIIRFKENQITHRFIQHYNFIQNLSSAKLSHRLGFEQFFANKEKPQYRSRYRATFQKPLSGEKADVKEWYLKLSNEYLYQFNKNDFEIRFSPYFGYQFDKKNTLEIGLDYRLGKIFEIQKSNNLWFRTTWYITL